MCVFELLKRFCECKIEFGILGGFENWMCAKLSSNFDIAPRKFCLHCQVIYAKILTQHLYWVDSKLDRHFKIFDSNKMTNDPVAS